MGMLDWLGVQDSPSSALVELEAFLRILGN